MSGEPRLEVLPDPEATSRAAAEAIVDALRGAVATRGRADWATTGGSTPVGIYRELSVEPGVTLPVANVHAPRNGDAIALSAGPEWVATEYADRLRDSGLPLSDDGFPILDIVLVGVGGDGHVLSVFPGSALFDSTAWVSAVPAPTHIEPHVPRVSMHPRILELARTPIVVIHGAAKAEMLATVLGAERDARQWPAQLARREGALWFVDRAAAASLPG